MRTVLLVTGMVSLVVVGAQTMRHVYVRWVERRDSVLERFQDRTEQEIMSAKSLPELVDQYEEAWKKVKEYEKEHPREDQENRYTRSEQEPYKSQQQLQQAVQTWEAQSRQLQELHIFWWFGLACIAIGACIFNLLNRWLGWAFVVLGYLEIQWATCPSFRTIGSQIEFDRLLTWKVAYSAITFALVLCGWIIAISRMRRPA